MEEIPAGELHQDKGIIFSPFQWTQKVRVGLGADLTTVAAWWINAYSGLVNVLNNLPMFISSDATQKHSTRVTELMKQNQYSPMSVAEMGTVLFAANEGFLDDVDVDKVVKFEAQMLDWMRSEQKDLLDKINEKGDYNDEIAAGLKAALEKFKTTQSW